MSEAMKRAEEAKRERLFFLATYLQVLTADILGALRERNLEEGNTATIARSIGRVQYINELMLSQGDVPTDIVLRGMFELSHSFGEYARNQPLNALEAIKKRFEVKEN